MHLLYARRGLRRHTDMDVAFRQEFRDRAAAAGAIVDGDGWQAGQLLQMALQFARLAVGGTARAGGDSYFYGAGGLPSLRMNRCIGHPA